jgi:hypothetical protein
VMLWGWGMRRQMVISQLHRYRLMSCYLRSQISLCFRSIG